MEMTGRVARQLLLISLLVLLIPLVLFPDRLGTSLAKVSLLNAVWELMYYGVVAVVLTQRAPFVRLLQVAGVCLIYRLVLGAAFGLLVTAVYSLDIEVSMTLGMSSYLPAIILHVAVAPFALWPLTTQLRRPTERPARPARVSARAPGAATREPAAGAPDRVRPLGLLTDPAAVAGPGPVTPLHTDSPPAQTPVEANGFERAARYLGEDGSVRAALVVDQEGLLLGHFHRGSLEAEDWAPFALMFHAAAGSVLRRAGWKSAEKLDCEVDHHRVVVAQEGSWWLLVLAERHASEVLNIRINQSLEMIRKYVELRYSQLMSPNAEKSHVSSAE